MAKREYIEHLLHRHERDIRRFVELRSGPILLQRTTVDDVLQETMTVALGACDQFVYAGEGQFLNWTFTIARWVMKKTLVRRGTVRLKSPQSSGPGVVGTEILGEIRTPSSLAASRESIGALLEAIQSLPERYRKAITVYLIEERSLAEVAAAVGCSRSAASGLIARGTNLLGSKLGRHGRSGTF